MSACSQPVRNMSGSCPGGSPARRWTRRASAASCSPSRPASSISAARRRRAISAPAQCFARFAFTMHMTLLGEKGLRRLAALNHAKAVAAAERLAQVPGVSLVNDSFFNEFTLELPKEARPAVREMADHGVLGGVSLGRLYPGEAGAGQRPGGGGHRDRHRRGCRGARQGARRGAGMSMNREGRPTRPEDAEGAAGTWTGNRALMLEEPLLFEIGDTETTGVDFEDARSCGQSPGCLGGPRARAADRPRRAHRAGDGAPLHPPLPPELCDRPRPVPARLLHDEAQSATEREGGADAGLRRHPPAAAGRHRPGRLCR